MIKKTTLFTAFALAAVTFLISCEKDETSPKSGKVIEINASAYNAWTYFSFDEDTVVNITNYTTSTDWDIAFHRSDVRVNCGQAGPGQGGSYNMGKINFNSVTEAPADRYSLNTTINILESYTMPPVYVTAPGDTLVSKWMTITTSNTAPPTYNYSDNIYVIRTAKGKYAKIWLTNYFNKQSQSGHITMKYVYQASGSRQS
ncbi:MAG TPA: HmuY family protein [Tenuifilaceae bacterium]|nr:HmuY family protein [Tenuifilaceae bacterium]